MGTTTKDVLNDLYQGTQTPTASPNFKKRAEAFRDAEQLDLKNAWVNPFKFAVTGAMAGMGALEFFHLFGIKPEDLSSWEIFKDYKYELSVVLASFGSTLLSVMVLTIMACRQEYWKQTKRDIYEWDKMSQEEQQHFKAFMATKSSDIVKNLWGKFLPLGTILFSSYNFLKVSMGILLKEYTSIGIKLGGNISIAFMMALIFGGCAKAMGILSTVPPALLPQIVGVFAGFASSDPLVAFFLKHFGGNNPVVDLLIESCIPAALGFMGAVVVTTGVSINYKATIGENMNRIEKGESPMTALQKAVYPLELLGRGIYTPLKRAVDYCRGYQPIPDPKTEETSVNNDQVSEDSNSKSLN